MGLISSIFHEFGKINDSSEIGSELGRSIIRSREVNIPSFRGKDRSIKDHVNTDETMGLRERRKREKKKKKSKRKEGRYVLARKQRAIINSRSLILIKTL